MHNGLLLSALWDAAFDGGLATFDDDGQPQFSEKLGEAARAGLSHRMPLDLTDKHRLRTLEHYVFPAIGDRRVSELRAADFAEMLRPIWLAKPETASRVRQRCDVVMKWSAAREYIVASPVAIVDQLLARQPSKGERVDHHPAVPWRAVPAFVQSVLRGGTASDGKEMLELLILTAARSGEIRGMTFGEIDWAQRVWTVPAARMKARMPHRVPLTPRAFALLESRLEHGMKTSSCSRRGGAHLTAT